MTVQKFGRIVPIPAEQLRGWQPTDEERERFAREREARKAETAAWRAKMDTIRSPMARKILELHSPNGREECEGCDVDGYEVEQPQWPCRTVHLVAQHFGRPAPEWVEL